MAVSERFEGANIVNAGHLSPYWGEHAARYRYALPLATGKTVLDIACGTGYGIGLLRERARYVLGVDVDADAARESMSECGPNASVLLGNGLGLPFADNTFDMVTSFETLEHLYERARFLKELRRVLRGGGILLLSTPNANYSQPVDGVPSNPFHIFEYTPEELRHELEGHFILESLTGQALDPSIKVPPFYDAQKKLPRDLTTQARLTLWKIFNKVPVPLRERLSNAIWGKPFYPTEADYNFDAARVDDAPTLLAVCTKD